MANDDRFTPTVQAIVDLLKSKQTDLELTDVWYGDQNLVPRTPSVAVEAGPFTRELAGQGGKGRTLNYITIFVFIYLNRIQDEQTTRQQADELSEAVMDALHEDVTISSHVIHGYVTEIVPGYMTKNRVLMRTARIAWRGLTKTQIV